MRVKVGCCNYSQLPLVLVHVAGGSGREVEARGDECEQDADLLVVVDGHVEQLLQRPDVLELVRVLASALLDNGSQVLENALGCVLHGLAAGADGDEAVISRVLDDVGAELGNLGLLLLFLGRLLDLLDLAHELVLVLPVQVDVLLELAVVLLDLLADGVEAARVDGVHLLGRDLLLLVRLEDKRLEVGNGLDVQLGHLAVVLLLQGGDLLVELVEYCVSHISIAKARAIYEDVRSEMTAQSLIFCAFSINRITASSSSNRLSLALLSTLAPSSSSLPLSLSASFKKRLAPPPSESDDESLSLESSSSESLSESSCADSSSLE